MPGPGTGPRPCSWETLLYKVGRSPWMGDHPVTRPLPTHRTTQTQNKRTQTFMPCVGFEPTIPAFERAKTVHVLDRVDTVIDSLNICNLQKYWNWNIIYLMTYFVFVCRIAVEVRNLLRNQHTSPSLPYSIDTPETAQQYKSRAMLSVS
jgi:hypothetical protein